MKPDSKPEIWAKKSLSQNFLVDQRVLGEMETLIATSVQQFQSPFVIEVGPGTGALTERILKHAHIVAIEKDSRAVELLATKFPDKPDHPHRLRVRKSDILRETLHELIPWAHTELAAESSAGKPVLIGNLPYAISSEFLLWACEQSKFMSEGHFLLQKEVSARLAAQCGSKAYGRLSVIVSLFFVVEEHFDVLPESFIPPPKVTSRFFSLKPTGFSFSSAREHNIFERLTAELFSKRRKMLRGALPEVFRSLNIPYDPLMAETERILADCGVKMTDRPERIPPSGFLNLARFLDSH